MAVRFTSLISSNEIPTHLLTFGVDLHQIRGTVTSRGTKCELLVCLIMSYVLIGFNNNVLCV